MKRLLLSFLIGAALLSAQTSSGIVSSGITASDALNVPLGGLQARYQASSVSGAQGTQVSSLPDTSGNGLTATQATSSKQPIINFNTVSGSQALMFTGSNILSLGGLPTQSLNDLVIPNGLTGSTQSLSMIAIWEPLQSLNTATNYVFNVGAATALANFGYGPVITVGAVTENDTRSLPWGPQVTGFVSQASGVQTVIGTALGSNLTALTSASFTGGIIGGKSAGNFQNGNLFELLVYNRALTQADLNQIYVYAQSRYAVQPASTSYLIALCGDSQTSGYAGSLYNYLSFAQQYKIANPTRDIYNFAQAGTTTSQLFSPDGAYSSIPTKKIVWVWSGTNDNANNSGGGSAWISTALTNLANFTAARRATGWQVIGVTMLPRGGASVSNANYESQRQTFNSTYRANAGGIYWDALFDIGNDATIGQAGDQTNATYFTTDQTHQVLPGVAITLTGFSTAVGSL